MNANPIQNPYDMSSENIVETGARLVRKYGWAGAIDCCWKFRDYHPRKCLERKFWIAVVESIRDVMPAQSEAA